MHLETEEPPKSDSVAPHTRTPAAHGKDVLHCDALKVQFHVHDEASEEMPWYFFFWTRDREHKLRQHDVEIEDFEDIVQNPDRIERSRSSDRWIAFGYDTNGEWTVCVYELDDDQTTVFPIAAYRPGD